MKKLLLAAVAVVSLASCRNDDNSSDEANVVGNWYLSKDVIISGKDNTVIFTETPTVCEKKSNAIFAEDNKYTYTIYSDISGTCAIKNSISLTYSFDKTNKKLIVDGEEVAILSLTKNEMQVVLDEYDENGDGIVDKSVRYLIR